MLLLTLQLVLRGMSLGNVGNLGIKGGTQANIKDYSYQVSLTYPTEIGTLVCGGSLITTKHIVTAAHCVIEFVDLNVLTVEAGSSELYNGLESRKVDFMITHRLYNKQLTRYDYDIAVVRVSEPFTIGPTINVIPLIEPTDVIPEGASAVATGWGEHVKGGPISKYLFKVEMPIVTDGQCKRYFPNVATNRVLCAGVQFEGKNVCKGDSGGPLVYEKKLVGISSFGFPCDGRFDASAFTRVSFYTEWVNDTIERNP